MKKLALAIALSGAMLPLHAAEDNYPIEFRDHIWGNEGCENLRQNDAEDVAECLERTIDCIDETTRYIEAINDCIEHVDSCCG